jgi:hypothetical protein
LISLSQQDKISAVHRSLLRASLTPAMNRRIGELERLRGRRTVGVAAPIGAEG